MCCISSWVKCVIFIAWHSLKIWMFFRHKFWPTKTNTLRCSNLIYYHFLGGYHQKGKYQISKSCAFWLRKCWLKTRYIVYVFYQISIGSNSKYKTNYIGAVVRLQNKDWRINWWFNYTSLSFFPKGRGKCFLTDKYVSFFAQFFLLFFFNSLLPPLGNRTSHNHCGFWSEIRIIILKIKVFPYHIRWIIVAV